PVDRFASEPGRGAPVSAGIHALHLRFPLSILRLLRRADLRSLIRRSVRGASALDREHGSDVFRLAVFARGEDSTCRGTAAVVSLPGCLRERAVAGELFEMFQVPA